MRVEVLSDHGGQQLRQTEQRLAVAGADLNSWQGVHREALNTLDATRRAKPLWRRVFSVSTPQERQARTQVEGAWTGVLRAGESARQVHQRVQQQAAGVWGEESLAAALAVLPDDWVMLRGYRNRHGETDHVLVGPLGVWAVEVKLRRVRLHVNGGQWWFEKLDSRGRAVETGWAVDGGGRSWARQVGEVAEELEAWLGRNSHPVAVRTAVMLMHPGAQLGRCENLEVDMVGTHPAHLLQAVAERAIPLAPDACARIVALIRRDHAFHAKRRGQA